jgi:hypothetical protein
MFEKDNIQIEEYERAKFNGFGEYEKYPHVKDRVNELMKLTKESYPKLDNFLLWLMVYDYVIRDELKIEIDDIKAKELYEKDQEKLKIDTYEGIKVVDIN